MRINYALLGVWWDLRERASKRVVSLRFDNGVQSAIGWKIVSKQFRNIDCRTGVAGIDRTSRVVGFVDFIEEVHRGLPKMLS